MRHEPLFAMTPRVDKKSEKQQEEEKTRTRYHRYHQERYGFLSADLPLVKGLTQRIHNIAKEMGIPVGQVYVINSPQINAFVMRGRNDVYIYHGVLQNILEWMKRKNLPLSQGNLDMVSAHEIAHLLQFQQIPEEKEENTGTENDLSHNEDVLRERRRLEFDADRRGLLALARSGTNPREGIHTIEMLHAISKRSAFGAHHPRSIDRVRELTLLVESPDTVLPNIDARSVRIDDDQKEILSESSERPGTRIYERTSEQTLPHIMTETANIFDALEVLDVGIWHERNRMIDQLMEDPRVLTIYAKMLFLENLVAMMNALIASQQRYADFSDRHHQTTDPRDYVPLTVRSYAEQRFHHQESLTAIPVLTANPSNQDVTNHVLRWLSIQLEAKENGVKTFLSAMTTPHHWLADVRTSTHRPGNAYDDDLPDDGYKYEDTEEPVPVAPQTQNPFLPPHEKLIASYAQVFLENYPQLYDHIDQNLLDRYSENIDTHPYKETWHERSSVHQDILAGSPKDLLHVCATDGNPVMQKFIFQQERIASRRFSGSIHLDTVTEWPYSPERRQDTFQTSHDRRRTLDYLLRSTLQDVYEKKTSHPHFHIKRGLWDAHRFGAAPADADTNCLRLPAELLLAFGERLGRHYCGTPTQPVLSATHAEHLGRVVAETVNEPPDTARQDLDRALEAVPQEERQRLLDALIVPIYPAESSAHPRFLGDIDPHIDHHLETRFQLIQGLLVQALREQFEKEGQWDEKREKALGKRLAQAIESSMKNEDLTWQYDLFIGSLKRQNCTRAEDVYALTRAVFDSISKTSRHGFSDRFLQQLLHELSPTLPIKEKVKLLALFDAPLVLAKYIYKLHEDADVWTHLPRDERMTIIKIFHTHIRESDLNFLDREAESAFEDRHKNCEIDQLFFDEKQQKEEQGWNFAMLAHYLSEEFLQILYEDGGDVTEQLGEILERQFDGSTMWKLLEIDTKPKHHWDTSSREKDYQWVWERAQPERGTTLLAKQVAAENATGRYFRNYMTEKYLHGASVMPDEFHDTDRFLAVLVERSLAHQNGLDYQGICMRPEKLFIKNDLLGIMSPEQQSLHPPIFDAVQIPFEDNIRFIVDNVPMRLRDEYLFRCMEAYGWANHTQHWFDDALFPGGIARLLSPLPMEYMHKEKVKPSIHHMRLGYVDLKEMASHYNPNHPSIIEKSSYQDVFHAPRADLLTQHLSPFRYHDTAETSPDALLDAFFKTIPEPTNFCDPYLITFEEEMRVAVTARPTPQRWADLLRIQRRIVARLQDPDEQLQMGRRAQDTCEQHVTRLDVTLDEQINNITTHFPHATQVRDSYLRTLSDSALVLTPLDWRRIQAYTVAEDRHLIGEKKTHQDQSHWESLSEVCAFLSKNERKEFILWLIGETHQPPQTFRAYGASMKRSVTDVPKVIGQATSAERQQLLLRVCLGPHGLLETGDEQENDILKTFIERLGSKLFRHMPKDMGKKGKHLLHILLETALTEHQPIRRFLILHALLEAIQQSEHGTFATRVRVLLEALGPAFIKGAQVLSEEESIDGKPLLPTSLQTALRTLKEQVSTFHRGAAIDIAQAEGEFDTTLGHDRLRSLDECLAAGSMKQVHLATTVDGTRVIEKFLRPSIGKQIDEDVRVLQLMAQRLEKVIDIPPGVVSRIERWVREEADLTQEVRHQEEMGAIVATYAERQATDDTLEKMPVIVPRILRASARHMREEYIRGISLEELSRRPDGKTITLPYRIQALDALFYQAFITGTFHADPHAGNLLITHDEKLAFIDLGNMGRIEPKNLPALRRFFLGTVFSDVDAVDSTLETFATGLSPKTRTAIQSCVTHADLTPSDRFHRIAAQLSSGTHALHPGFEKFIKMLVTSSYLMRDIPPETLGPLVMKYLQE